MCSEAAYRIEMLVMCAGEEAPVRNFPLQDVAECMRLGCRSMVVHQARVAPE